MTPKEKANDLISKFRLPALAILAAEEVLSVINVYQIQDMTHSERWQVLFWKEVKKELEKL